jgi:hypothetical protein
MDQASVRIPLTGARDNHLAGWAQVEVRSISLLSPDPRDGPVHRHHARASLAPQDPRVDHAWLVTKANRIAARVHALHYWRVLGIDVVVTQLAQRSLVSRAPEEAHQAICRLRITGCVLALEFAQAFVSHGELRRA